jgi:serine-type D-Ala-D-Ala carboxypeptidase/endopeptidase (penicillin-binding protein 4)
VRNTSFVTHYFRLIIVLGLPLFLSSCQPQPNPQGTQTNLSTRMPSSPGLAVPPAPITANLVAPSPSINNALKAFLKLNVASGAPSQTQGVWIQNDSELLANYQGTVPLSAASLTKAATSLAALATLGPNYRYKTLIGTTGKLQNGVLQGDLVIQGGQNPFFVWEDAIALTNQLKQQGIQEVMGNLIVLGPFYMNFVAQPATAGTLLKQGLDASLWPAEAQQQYASLPPGTPKPQLTIRGSVVAASTVPTSTHWIAQQQSFPLADLLKKMNRYSNNAMAEMIATSIGGASVVQQKAILLTGVPAAEIHLVNGSGLAVENRMTPRAVCGIFLAINQLLKPQGMSIADIFNVVGKDEGVLDYRALPRQAVLKSGTLDTVSALAGTISTQKAGRVWFAVLDNDGDVDMFRNHQEALLATLQQTLGVVPAPSTGQAEQAALSYSQLWTRL